MIIFIYLDKNQARSIPLTKGKNNLPIEGRCIIWEYDY